MPEKYTRTPNIKCSICSKAVYRRPAEIESHGGRAFCSPACFGKSCRKEVPCLVCSTPILAGLHKKTCSRACSNKHREGIRYKLSRPRDRAQKSRALKTVLLLQKGSKCERCTYNKPEVLQVHHKDRNRNNNKIDNLELVCPNCHYEEHYLEKSWLKK